VTCHAGLVSKPWIAAVRSAIGTLSGAVSATDLNGLVERLSPLAWRDDSPDASEICAGASGYSRYLIASAESFSAILIAWPPGHTTPLHDHGGLWGMELVLDGAIAVDEFRGESDSTATSLTPERTIVLGIGDATAFSAENYVHRCRNLSPRRTALSLHVYGGELERYNVFGLSEEGRFRATTQHAPITATWNSHAL
jgi:predicted metal-dependent enzyme (double-stranded beta helix superfamily)